MLSTDDVVHILSFRGWVHNTLTNLFSGCFFRPVSFFSLFHTNTFTPNHARWQAVDCTRHCASFIIHIHIFDACHQQKPFYIVIHIMPRRYNTTTTIDSAESTIIIKQIVIINLILVFVFTLLSQSQ